MSIKKIYVCDYCGNEFSNKNDLFTCFNNKDICENCVKKFCSCEKKEKTLGDIAEKYNISKKFPKYRYLAQDNYGSFFLFNELPYFHRGEWFINGERWVIGTNIIDFFELLENYSKNIYDLKEKKLIVIE